MRRLLRNTDSICPVCNKKIEAGYYQNEDSVFFEKNCAEHGFFSTVVWRGRFFQNWLSDIPEHKSHDNCPYECGLCNYHRQDTCCVILNVTNECNLNCAFCFADSKKNGSSPSLEMLSESLKELAVPGQTLVQLSGGEPTIRDDLPEIVAVAKKAGCAFIQLNSNGIRLANDRQFVKKLSDAGLSFVFMQFDGTDDDVYEKLRGRKLFDEKKRAIENCARHNIGVVLVPMLVRNVNINEIGSIISFGMKNSPNIRGIHFQPATYFGRIPSPADNDMRVTLDELLAEIERQTSGQISSKNLLPSCCDHPLCGFHGDFVITPDGIKSLSTRKINCCDMASADKNRNFVVKRWVRPRQAQLYPFMDMTDMESFLSRVKTHGFTITSMAFQDKYTLDLDRLSRCSLHVYQNGKYIPFCAHHCFS